MVNKDVFDKLTTGVMNGISKTGFGIGDGLDYEAGCDEESDGEYVLRAFYYDDDTELEHVLKIHVTIEVEDIRSIEDDDCEDDDE